VVPRVKTASSSGEILDKVDTDVYGQAGSKDIALVFVADVAIGTWDWVAEVAEDGGGIGDTEIDGDLNEIIMPGSVVITDGVEIFTDNGEGKLESNLVNDDGKINYVKGEWEVELLAAAAADLNIDYSWLDETTDLTEILGTGESNSVGSWMKRIEIPDWTAYDTYYVASLDAKGNTGDDDFTIGAVLTATPDEVDVGDLITVKGRGFTSNEQI